MSNNYDSMAGAMSSGNELGEVALYSSLVACSVWPEHLLAPIPADKSGILLKQLQRIPTKDITVSLPTGSVAASVGVTNVPARLFLIRTDTGKMLQACSMMHESGSAGHRFLEELDRQYYSISTGAWAANDQEAYSRELSKYRNAVQNTYCLAWETALLTSIVATLRFIQLAIAAALAGILAVMATAFWAVVFIPVVGQGLATSIRTAGMALARMLPTVIRMMDEIMVKVGWVHAGLLAVRTAQAAISDNMRLGDNKGFSDLGKGAGEVLDDLLKKLILNRQASVLSGF
ncbi:MAG TPA: hypothetical protein VFX61_15605 [Micromonosporaceae bacterium]|nr:hypothetical protein [Micromonosporaceae bacterium]